MQVWAILTKLQKTHFPCYFSHSSAYEQWKGYNANITLTLKADKNCMQKMNIEGLYKCKNYNLKSIPCNIYNYLKSKDLFHECKDGSKWGNWSL